MVFPTTGQISNEIGYPKMAFLYKVSLPAKYLGFFFGDFVKASFLSPMKGTKVFSGKKEKKVNKRF